MTPPSQDGTRREHTPSKGPDTCARGDPAESTANMVDGDAAAWIARAVAFHYEHEIEDWIAREEGLDRPHWP
jgi:hypothetical protein